MAESTLDRALVRDFVAGGLGPSDEAELADQVARILPFHMQLPHPVLGDMIRVIDHIGGDEKLLAWLAGHPGRPRLVARLFEVIALLDDVSGRPAIVTALRELREQEKYPEGLERAMPPATDDSTLASVSWQIESRLADGDDDEAFRIAVASVDLLRRIAPRAAELDEDAREIEGMVERTRQDLVGVSP
jgi:hypothetical protein